MKITKISTKRYNENKVAEGDLVGLGVTEVNNEVFLEFSVANENRQYFTIAINDKQDLIRISTMIEIALKKFKN